MDGGALARPLEVVTVRGNVSAAEKFKDRPEAIEIINRVQELAKKRSTTMAVVATAWILSKGTAPIVGLSSIERIDEAISAVSFKLSEEEIKYLEEPYKPRSPHI